MLYYIIFFAEARGVRGRRVPALRRLPDARGLVIAL